MPSRDDIRSLSTEQRWIPPSTVRRDALTPESRNDLIFRKVRGILNKLTPEKFAKLSNDLLNVELNSHVILKGVIFLVCIFSRDRKIRACFFFFVKLTDGVIIG